MKNLHKIRNEEVSQIHKAILWWITEYTWAPGDFAQIRNDNTIHRINRHLKDLGEYSKRDSDYIMNIWKVNGKPDYKKELVRKG